MQKPGNDSPAASSPSLICCSKLLRGPASNRRPSPKTLPPPWSRLQSETGIDEKELSSASPATAASPKALSTANSNACARSVEKENGHTGGNVWPDEPRERLRASFSIRSYPLQRIDQLRNLLPFPFAQVQKTHPHASAVMDRLNHAGQAKPLAT